MKGEHLCVLTGDERETLDFFQVKRYIIWRKNMNES